MGLSVESAVELLWAAAAGLAVSGQPWAILSGGLAMALVAATWLSLGRPVWGEAKPDLRRAD